MNLSPNDIALSASECSQLALCETAIERGMSSFIEVGNALLEIRYKRLYRNTHPTFEDYCSDRWKMKRTYAFYVIEAAKVASNLDEENPTFTMVNKPVSERQTRPLRNLHPDQQREAWRAAVEDAGGEQPTAKQVETAARNVRPIAAPALSPAKEAEVKSASSESDALFGLKRYWQKAGKRDRETFLKWIKTNP